MSELSNSIFFISNGKLTKKKKTPTCKYTLKYAFKTIIETFLLFYVNILKIINCFKYQFIFNNYLNYILNHELNKQS